MVGQLPQRPVDVDDPLHDFGEPRLGGEVERDVVEPGDCTMATVPARFAELGDLHAGIDAAPYGIDELLDWAARDEREGAADVPVDEPG